MLDSGLAETDDDFLIACQRRMRQALSLCTREEAACLMRLAGLVDTDAFRHMVRDPRPLLSLDPSTVRALVDMARGEC